MSGVDASPSGGFSPRLMAAIIGGGIVFFLMFWALVAFGPSLSSGNNGGAHALSRGAPGFAGIAELADRVGMDSSIRRDVPEREPTYDADGDSYASLLILTPTLNTDADKIEELIKSHGDQPVLIILPKWRGRPDPKKAGWVMGGDPSGTGTSMLPGDLFGEVKPVSGGAAGASQQVVDVGGRDITLPLPRAAKRVSGSAIDAVAAHPAGGALLARGRARSQHYILADPDLLSNLALRDADHARAAIDLLDAIAEDSGAESLVWDVTLNGFGSNESIVRFAFTPPFAGITVALLAAGLLALWQSWFRFGPALRARRAIALSKQALISNSADMIVQAGRELDAAGGYASHLRDMIAAGLHAPPGLRGAALDAWLDRFTPPGREPFSVLGTRMLYARSKDEMLSLAQALSDWRKDVLRDHR